MASPDKNDLTQTQVFTPLAFRLDKVDQHWFLDLVLGSSLLRARTKAS